MQNNFIPSRFAAVIEYDLRANNETEKPYVAQLKCLISVELKNVIADKPHELYSAFSVYKNGVKLFDVDRKASPNVLKSLYGLRTLAMLHIMLGHRYSWSRGFPNVNSNIHAVDGKWLKTLFSAFVVVSPIAVDSFFVMGGLLITRSILHQMEKFVVTMIESNCKINCVLF